MASRYPALGKVIQAKAGDGEPTIHDAATAAVEHKSGGSALDAGVSDRVGAHLGADFSGVRVHQDPLSQEATAAMGARAFAYGNDVFLGPGESGGDLGLMAHELTHVVQQGAAGQRSPQRQVQVGDANSPAEHQADQVAAEVTSGTGQPAHLLVDDGPVTAGQMLKSQFIDQLRAQVTDAANQELGPIYSAIGCPYIDQYFGRYAGQPASAGEALIKRFAPATRSARTAAEMIPLVVERVREGVRTWRDTGRPPPEIAAAEPAAAAASAAPNAQALRTPDGRETTASLEAELGPGASLDGGTASRMSSALGVDVSSARIHTGAVAARKADEVGAVAFAVGHNVVMGRRAPAAGTIEGDALLAHELSHAAQQSDAASDPVARMQPIGGESAAAEAHADGAVAGALTQLHGQKSGVARLAERVGGVFKTGLQLQRCPDTPAEKAHKQLVKLGGLAESDFRREVGAMSRSDFDDMMSNVSSADQSAFAALLSRIRNERLVGTTESLNGKLYWAGNSGADPGSGFQIKTSTARPKDNDLVDGVAGNDVETNTNAFAVWVRGGAEPTDTSKMNCWEAILYGGWKAGVITKAWIDKVHADAASDGQTTSTTAKTGGAGNAQAAGLGIAAYDAAIAKALGFGSATTWNVGDPTPPRGNIVFFNRTAHVALSTGNTVGGKSEVMSLWILPAGGTGNFNSNLQRTTIEDIVASITSVFPKYGQSTSVVIKHGPNPWK